MKAPKLIDQEIMQGLSLLSDKHKKVILSVVKSFAEMNHEGLLRQTKAWANDKLYEAEMNKRFNDLTIGKVKGISFSKLEAGAKKAFNARVNKKA